MSKIKIKNFGPIKAGFIENDGFMDIEKVTVFIGNQGAGKSVVAKLITTFFWIEKALTRGDYDIKWFSRKNKLRNQFLSYFRLENYFSELGIQEKTYFEYKGGSFHIIFENGNLSIEHTKNGDYPLPQIMYVPAERNFISNVKKAKALNLTSDSLVEFVSEYNNALNEMKGPMLLPVNNNVYVEYNKLNDIVYLKGKDYRIKLTEASSGFQSLVPLFLVSWFLSNSVKRQSENTKELMTSEQRERFRKRFQVVNENSDLTEEQKRIAISELAKEFNKTAFINIVEEPEQNLFPNSQWALLKELLAFNNLSAGNRLIMTSHSPYIINYLSIAIEGGNLLDKIIKVHPSNSQFKEKLENVVPIKSVIKSSDVVIYQLNENTGEVEKLPTYDGIPSDKNFLNKLLAEGNQLFDSLLEIEQAL